MTQESDPKTSVIAHRGGAGLFSENTMAAFEKALAIGVHGLEIDVHLSRDGHVVVHHDAALRPDTARYPDGELIREPLPISSLSLSEIQQFDVGTIDPKSPYAKLYPHQKSIAGAKIPVFQDVLNLVRQRKPKTRLFIEMKSTFYDPNPAFDPEPLMSAVIANIHDLQMRELCLIMSLDWRYLAACRRLAPDLRRSYTTLPGLWLKGTPPPEHAPLPKGFTNKIAAMISDGPDWLLGFKTRDWGPDVIDFIARDDNADWSPNHYDVTSALVEHAASKSMKTYVWTPDQPDHLKAVLSLGVDGVVTDYPDRALELFEPISV